MDIYTSLSHGSTQYAFVSGLGPDWFAEECEPPMEESDFESESEREERESVENNQPIDPAYLPYLKGIL